jgi:hypothetical protein
MEELYLDVYPQVYKTGCLRGNSYLLQLMQSYLQSAQKNAAAKAAAFREGFPSVMNCEIHSQHMSYIRNYLRRRRLATPARPNSARAPGAGTAK